MNFVYEDWNPLNIHNNVLLWKDLFSKMRFMITFRVTLYFVCERYACLEMKLLF